MTSATPAPSTTGRALDALERFVTVRRFTEQLCDPLCAEDYVIQSMPDASPVKWHLAHTSWFFETFVLAKLGEAPFDPRYGYLFNSYYDAVGARHERPQRGLLSRPTVEEIRRYRAHVDERMRRCLDGTRGDAAIESVVELGLHHEQQHQELLLTDVKHAFAQNPLRPAYREPRPRRAAPAVAPHAWIAHAGGVAAIGHDGARFAFDNETPRHSVYVHDFQLGDRLVTNGEYLAFMADGGYARPALWLSDGWIAVREHRWNAPLYWEEREGARFEAFTLEGLRDVEPSEPVCHVSYYEADAFARWAGARLPTEAEWEVIAAGVPAIGNFVESGELHPTALADASETRAPRQLFGDAWEWTSSGYASYPGFRALPGALGEYNGKFMCNQLVLRGGSCATSASHIRPTYRNFFPAHARWQFSGIRLAK